MKFLLRRPTKNSMKSLETRFLFLVASQFCRDFKIEAKIEHLESDAKQESHQEKCYSSLGVWGVVVSYLPERESRE